MKKIAYVLIILGILTSCSNNHESINSAITKGIVFEDLYSISLEFDENQTGLSEEEVIQVVEDAFSNTRLIVDVYLNDETRLFDQDFEIDVYDPFLTSTIFIKDPTDPSAYILPDENKDKWIQYLMQYGEQSKKIKTLLVNNNIKGAYEDWEATVDFYFYLDDIREIDVDHYGTIYAGIMRNDDYMFQIHDGVSGEVINRWDDEE